MRRRPATFPGWFLLLVFFGVPAGGTAARAGLPPGFQQTILADNMPQASGFTFLPDGRAIVVRKLGIVHVVTPFGANAPLDTIPNVYTYGESGLNGVVVDPGWPTRPYLYFFYSQASPRANVLERYRATGSLSAPGSANLALDQPYRILEIADPGPNHNAGALKFDDLGRLLVTHGDDFRSCVAQDDTTLNGCLMRLDLSSLPAGPGGPPPRAQLVPPDNPFAATGTNAALILCNGLRNPYRIAWDPVTDRVYAGDVGALLYEEIDEIAGVGENFGWPVWEADSLTGEDCGAGAIPYTSPIVKYFHDPADTLGPPNFFAIIQGPRYRRGAGAYTFPPEYEGALLYADHGKGWIRMAQEDSGQWSSFTVPGQPDPVNWATGYHRISDFQQGPDGALYLTTIPGRFVRIYWPGEPSAVPATLVAPGPAGLGRVTPNPFRAGQGVAMLDAARGPAEVFDHLGRRLRRLETPAWDGLDAHGRPAPPGAYWIVTDGRRGRVTVLR